MPIYTQPVMHINLDHVAFNYQALTKWVKPVTAAAVVKNNAYSTGDVRVAARLYNEGCRHFFVAHALEGKRIRPVVKDSTIYVLQGIGDDTAAIFNDAFLTPVISTPVQLAFWENNKIKGIKPILQIDTGLNRLGFRSPEVSELTAVQKKSFSYVLSHLACADDPGHFMNEFQRLTFETMKGDLNFLPATFAATDGAFLGTAYRYDMVRFGAGLYGLNPFHPGSIEHVLNKHEKGSIHKDEVTNLCLKQVMYIKAPVLQMVDLKKGASVGYGATYQAQQDMRLAVVSIGYGDGLPRCLSNKGFVRFNGVSAPIIGRISMDNIMVDARELCTLKEGDFVSILDDVYTADKMAQAAGTIGYEILSNFGKGERFCKNYIG